MIEDTYLQEPERTYYRYQREEDMADASQMERMLPVREVARLLHVHGNTVRRWSDKGIIRAYRINPRGDRRFSREDIPRILLELKTNGGSPTKVKNLP